VTCAKSAITLFMLGAAGLLLCTAALAQAPPLAPADGEVRERVFHLADGAALTATIGVGTTSSSTLTTIRPTTTTLPPSVCADPGMNGITASDALTLLRASIGAVPCAACICDVDGNGIVTATDALITLAASAGIPATLNCPACA